MTVIQTHAHKNTQCKERLHHNDQAFLYL